MIKRLIIKNFKGIKDADIIFDKAKNVIVGNNGVGKSTIIEALTLAMGYGLNRLEVTPHLFHVDCIRDFKESKQLPYISVEVFFDSGSAEFSGTNNSIHRLENGLRLKISFDDEAFSELFDKEKDICKQIPCEYYKVERYWFSDTIVRQNLIPYHVLVIDSSSTYFNASSNQYIASILKKYIGTEDIITIRSTLRQLSEDFDQYEKMQEVNTKLSKDSSDLRLSIDITSSIIFRNIICPFLNDIPIEQIGQGDLCILKTMLSLDKRHMNDKPKLIIIEEPETHLSHTKMYELLRKIEDSSDENTQLIITTHSNFVANKLDLSNLLLIDNNAGKIQVQKMDNRSTELTKFFTKVSNYPTLRLILCKSAILVEGPTDEMIVTYYYKKTYNRHPFDDGIELISVEGVKFKQYAELGKAFNKKIAIITDNDGMTYNEVLQKRGLNQLPESIHVYTERNTTLNTLEPSFVEVNEEQIQDLASVILPIRLKEPISKEKINKFMKNNKTEWAFRLLENIEKYNFNVPEYIKNAINWLRTDARE